MSNRELLDAITVYQKARDQESTARSTPPEFSVDERADQAVKLLNDLIDARIKLSKDEETRQLKNGLRN